MPIYEYSCSSCHKLTDVLQKLNEGAPELCPACGAEGTLSRVVSRTSFVLKGGGWGSDLYASKKADAPTTPTAESAKPDKNGAPAATPGAPSTATPTASAPSASPATPKPASNKGESGS